MVNSLGASALFGSCPCLNYEAACRFGSKLPAWVFRASLLFMFTVEVMKLGVLC